MSGRFRIRTSHGHELSFATHEMFAEFVRSGDLSPDDVVYDASTREWAPARAHPVVLQIELATEDLPGGDRRGASRSEDPEDREVGESFPGDAAIGLDLAPKPPSPSPEEAAAAFVAQMEAERAAEREAEGWAPAGELRMGQGSSSLLEEVAPPGAEPSVPPPWRGPAIFDEPVAADPFHYEPVPSREAPLRRGDERKVTGSGVAAGRYARVAVVVAGATAASVYFGLGLGAPATGEGVEAGMETAAEPSPLIPNSEEALRARALERFLTSTREALRGLDPVPEVWLHGAYLAEPSDFPRVREVWEEYLTTIRQVRAAEGDRYREAYLRSLDDARVQGATRTLRLAGAAADFEASGAARAAHYERVEALALAAIRGHDALVEAEGTIAYQPAAGPGVSGDPVIEAVGRGPEAQLLLNQVLDMILVHLHVEQGPGESANVREWVWDGILDAVTG